MRRVGIVGVVVLVVAVLAYFWAVTSPQSTPTPTPVAATTAPAAPATVEKTTPKKLEKISFRLSWVHDLAYGGLYLAHDKGYFADEGLDVTIQPGGFGLDPVKQVGAGSDQFGIAGAGNLLVARQKGVPIVAIGTYFQRSGVGYFTRKDSGITKFSQFKGKRVGVQTGTDTDTTFRALLALNHMTSADVVEVPIQYDMAPFVSGNIDVLPGYVTNQPITLAAKGIETNIISADSEGLKFYGSIFITTEKMIAEHPELVRRFMRAMQRGWALFFKDKQAAVEAARRWAPEFDTKVLPKIYDAAMPLIRADIPGIPINGMTAERWKVTEKVMRTAGLVKGKLDLQAAYTLKFLK